jgi:hypothetical protein
MELRPIFFYALMLLITVLTGCTERQQGAAHKSNQDDPAKNPVYTRYRFGQERGVLDLGVQPLALPESPVGELLSRDGTLAGHLTASGASLKPHPFFKGRDINYFLLRGDLEAGIAGDMPSLTAAATGDIVVTCIVKQGFSSVISRRPMLVKDLKGKRVATALGSTAHFTLLNALENEGLSESDITLVPLEAGEMPRALDEGRVDAVSAWEPTPTIILSAHPDYHLVYKGINMSFLYFRRDFVAAHPRETRYITAAVARACSWMRVSANLEQAVRWSHVSASHLFGAKFPISYESMMSLTRNDLLNVPRAPHIDERILEKNGLLWNEFEFLKKKGKIPSAVSWDRVRRSFDMQMLRDAVSEPERYGLDRFDYTADSASGGRP